MKPNWGCCVVTNDRARQQTLLSRGQFPMELARNFLPSREAAPASPPRASAVNGSMRCARKLHSAGRDSMRAAALIYHKVPTTRCSKRAHILGSLVTGVTDSARLPRAPLGAFATEFDLYRPLRAAILPTR